VAHPTIEKVVGKKVVYRHGLQNVQGRRRQEFGGGLVSISTFYKKKIIFG